MIDPKHLDHAYHRSRVDAQINGQIALVAIMSVLALAIGQRFKPLVPGARWLEPARLVWVEDQSNWVAEKELISHKNYPPVNNHGPVVTQEIYPISVTLVIVLAVLTVSYLVYRCARRQARLMNSVFGDGRDDVYQRRWEDVRLTFWGLNLALLFALFVLVSN